MEGNATVVFGICVGEEVNETQFGLMTTKPEEKTRVVLKNFEQLSQSEKRNEIHDQFCDALIAYNVSILCVRKGNFQHL